MKQTIILLFILPLYINTMDNHYPYKHKDYDAPDQFALESNKDIPYEKLLETFKAPCQKPRDLTKQNSQIMRGRIHKNNSPRSTYHNNQNRTHRYNPRHYMTQQVRHYNQSKHCQDYNEDKISKAIQLLEAKRHNKINSDDIDTTIKQLDLNEKELRIVLQKNMNQTKPERSDIQVQNALMLLNYRELMDDADGKEQIDSIINKSNFTKNVLSKASNKKKRSYKKTISLIKLINKSDLNSLKKLNLNSYDIDKKVLINKSPITHNFLYQTPLIKAIEIAHFTQNTEILSLILKSKANPNVFVNNQSPLAYAEELSKNPFNNQANNSVIEMLKYFGAVNNERADSSIQSKIDLPDNELIES